MRRLIVILLATTVLAFLISRAATVLVTDGPLPSDTILVVAGETDKRPALGLELLHQKFAPHLIFDVPAKTKFFNFSELDLAKTYVASLPDAKSITVCPIYGFSTQAEARDSSECLRNLSVHRVLLVTSDYHTRRTLSIFRKDVPDFDYSIAAAYDPQQFGPKWWQQREWAKTLVSEYMRLAWWEAVDRWR